MILRLRFRIVGGHVHCRLFTAPALTQTFAKSGDLVFRIDEWPALHHRWHRTVEFIDEDDVL